MSESMFGAVRPKLGDGLHFWTNLYSIVLYRRETDKIFFGHNSVNKISPGQNLCYRLISALYSMFSMLRGFCLTVNLHIFSAVLSGEI